MALTTKNLNDYYHAEVELSGREVKQSVEDVVPLIRKLLTSIHKEDSRFRGDPLCVGSYFQGLKVAKPDEFDFSVPLALELTGKCSWGAGGKRYYGFKKTQTDNKSPSCAPPSSGYGSPSSGYGSPSAGYDTSSSGYGSPSAGYGTPSAGYGSPSAGYGSPSAGYGSPSSGHGARSFVPDVVTEAMPASNHDSSTDTAREDVEVVKTSVPLPDPPTGYLFANPEIPAYHLWDKLMCDRDVVPFLVRRQLKRLLEEAIRKLELRDEVRLMRKMKSPAVTLLVQSNNGFDISVDVAPILRLHLPFAANIRWPRPDAKWPSRRKIDEIKRIGIDCVAKKDFVWRLCYAEAEKELVKNIDEDGGCRKRCHRIMKKLNNDVWFNTTKPVVSSYTLKNLLFWECENQPDSSSWVQSKLEERFTAILHNLYRKLMERNIPHYFHPDVNMLKDKDPKEIEIGLQKIAAFMGDPQKYLKV